MHYSGQFTISCYHSLISCHFLLHSVPRFLWTQICQWKCESECQSMRYAQIHGCSEAYWRRQDCLCTAHASAYWNAAGWKETSDWNPFLLLFDSTQLGLQEPTFARSHRLFCGLPASLCILAALECRFAFLAHLANHDWIRQAKLSVRTADLSMKISINPNALVGYLVTFSQLHYGTSDVKVVYEHWTGCYTDRVALCKVLNSGYLFSKLEFEPGRSRIAAEHQSQYTVHWHCCSFYPRISSLWLGIELDNAEFKFRQGQKICNSPKRPVRPWGPPSGHCGHFPEDKAAEAWGWPLSPVCRS